MPPVRIHRLAPFVQSLSFIGPVTPKGRLDFQSVPGASPEWSESTSTTECIGPKIEKERRGSGLLSPVKNPRSKTYGKCGKRGPKIARSHSSKISLVRSITTTRDVQLTNHSPPLRLYKKKGTQDRLPKLLRHQLICL